MLPPAIAGLDDAERAAAQPDGQLLGRPGRRALREQRAGVAGSAGASSRPLNSDPTAHDGIPILHGNPYGPTVTDGQPNCQAGQTGYPLGEALLPGQARTTRPSASNVARLPRRPITRQDRPLPDPERRPHLLGLANNPPENPSAQQPPPLQFQIGLIAIVLTFIGFYLAFTKSIPFAGHGYQLKAVFADAQNIRAKSPVRISGRRRRRGHRRPAR